MSEAARLKEILGQEALQIHHVGSTSVPGLSAKEDIDILCIVRDIESFYNVADYDLIHLLEAEGYTYKGELNIPMRHFFSRNSDVGKVNLHLCDADHDFANRILAFRDLLRNNEAVRDQYGAFKTKLASNEGSGEKIAGSMPQYTLEKNEFITECLKKTVKKAKMMTTAMHYSEIEFINRLLPELDVEPCLLGPEGAIRMDEVFLVFYSGAELIGAAKVDFTMLRQVSYPSVICVRYKMDKKHNKPRAEKAFTSAIGEWVSLVAANNEGIIYIG